MTRIPCGSGGFDLSFLLTVVLDLAHKKLEKNLQSSAARALRTNASN
jgi:hypothetical protein